MCHCLFDPCTFSQKRAPDEDHRHADPERPRKDPPERANGRDWKAKPEHDAPRRHVEGNSPALNPPQLTRIEREVVHDAERDRDCDYETPVVRRSPTSPRSATPDTLALSVQLATLRGHSGTLAQARVLSPLRREYSSLASLGPAWRAAARGGSIGV